MSKSTSLSVVKSSSLSTCTDSTNSISIATTRIQNGEIQHRQQRLFKDNIFRLFACVLIVVLLASCDNPLSPKSKSSSTNIVFSVSDPTGSTGDCYYRIIEPVADVSTTFNIYPKYQQNVGWNGSYTFENVEPGSYGCIIGGIGETYRDFSIASGEHVVIKMEKSIGGYITTYYGTTVPVYQWSVAISKT